jgi:hypothetical protein
MADNQQPNHTQNGNRPNQDRRADRPYDNRSNNANRRNDNRQESARQDNNGDRSGKAPNWRKPIAEPREEAERAKSRNDGGNNAPRRAPIDPKDLLDKYGRQAKVVVQNAGETRALVDAALQLDGAFSLIRENIFGRLPGEYGALALRDAGEAIDKLLSIQTRLKRFGIGKSVITNFKRRRFIEAIAFNQKAIERYHVDKLRDFAKEAERLRESLKVLGVEGEAVSETLKNAIETFENRESAEAERIAKEQEEARKAREEEKARRKAEYEARQAEIAEQKRLKADEANRAKQAEIADKSDAKGANDRSPLDRIDDQSVDRLAETPSLTADQESEAEQGTKPSKSKKDKEKAV